MKKVSEYRKHAEECRLLARQTVVEEHRRMLADMATTWDLLAETRARSLAKTGAPID